MNEGKNAKRASVKKRARLVVCISSRALNHMEGIKAVRSNAISGPGFCFPILLWHQQPDPVRPGPLPNSAAQEFPAPIKLQAYIPTMSALSRCRQHNV